MCVCVCMYAAAAGQVRSGGVSGSKYMYACSYVCAEMSSIARPGPKSEPEPEVEAEPCVSPTTLALAWPGLAWPGLAWPGLAWLGLVRG